MIDGFVDLSSKVNIVIELDIFLRTAKVKPDEFYIQNIRTYELYLLNHYNASIYYYDKLPAGVYRVGYWLAGYDIGDVKFKSFCYSDITINLNKSQDYSLGKYFYQAEINSLKINPIKMALTQKKFNDEKFKYYVPVEEISVNKIEDSEIYKECGYGEAYYTDDNFEKLRSTLLKSAKIEKEIMDSYYLVIDKNCRSYGPEQTLELIKGFFTLSKNINLLIKKSEVLYKAGLIEEAKKILDEIFIEDPNTPEYFGLKGIVEFKNNNFEKANDYFYRSVSLKAKWGIIYDYYAQLLIQKNNINLAKEISDYSMLIEVNNLNFLETNLKIYQKLNDNKKIEEINRKIFELTRDSKDKE